MTDAPRYIPADELPSLLSPTAAVDALEAGFLARSEGGSVPDAHGSVIAHEAGELMVMPAAGPEGVGAKLVTSAPANPARGLPLINGLYVLFSRDTSAPEVLIDGAGLSQLRTAALSALAARHLARPDSRRLVIFGAGAQAEGHARLFPKLFPIEEVTIVATSPRSPRAVALREALERDGATAVRIGSPEDVAGADLVCTCTPATEPVFDSALLSPGAHVTAVGSYKPEMREFDLELSRRALIVVETLAMARKESGELIEAIEAGVLPEEAFAHVLSDLLRGTVERENPDQPSVFKSVGLPFEDLIIARAVAGTERSN
jgi:ornithine cyclodeaminase